MQKIIINRTQVNPERLQEELDNIAGYQGLSTNSAGVIVYMDEGVNPTPFRDIVMAHDATALSSAQLERDALRAEIITLKQSVGNIDSLTATEATAAIKLLYKVLRANDLI